jgi:hypothetical protein
MFSGQFPEAFSCLAYLLLLALPNKGGQGSIYFCLERLMDTIFCLILLLLSEIFRRKRIILMA